MRVALQVSGPVPVLDKGTVSLGVSTYSTRTRLGSTMAFRRCERRRSASMAARFIASPTLSLGLVSIPVWLYSRSA